MCYEILLKTESAYHCCILNHVSCNPRSVFGRVNLGDTWGEIKIITIEDDFWLFELHFIFFCYNRPSFALVYLELILHAISTIGHVMHCVFATYGQVYCLFFKKNLFVIFEKCTFFSVNTIFFIILKYFCNLVYAYLYWEKLEIWFDCKIYYEVIYSKQFWFELS